MLRVVCHELASTWIGKRRRGLKARAFRTELTSLVQCLLLTLVVIAQVGVSIAICCAFISCFPSLMAA